MKRDLLEKPFSPEQIKQREGTFGKLLAYIEGHAVIQRLNDAFDAEWSFTLFRFNTVSWISQKFREYADEVELKHRRFHDLRHTYGSHMAMKGKNPFTIKELMRHKSLAVL